MAQSRLRRFLFHIASADTQYHQTAGRGGKVHFSLTDSVTSKPMETPIHTAMQTASKIISSGGDLITAPAIWLRDMQKNWVVYVVAAAVIMFSILLIYFAIRCYFIRRPNNKGSTTDVIELVKAFGCNGMSARQLPLVSATVPSVISTITDHSKA